MRRISKMFAGAVAALALLVAGAPVGMSAAADSSPQQLRRGADDKCKNKPTPKLRKKCRAKHEGGKEDGPNHQ